MTPERDPLLEELEERIIEGPVIFTPDEDFIEKLRKNEEELT
jgi:hypothetical protein